MNKKLLKRLLELSDIKPVIKESKMNLSNFELVKKSVNGNTYAIVRENTKYYIKSSQTKENLKESDFDYLGGLANKGRKYFNSFEEATRNLNLMFEEINNHYDGVDNVNLLESDLLNEKKYVLKLNKPKAKAEPKEPMTDFGSAEEKNTDTGTDDFDFGGGDEETEDDFDFGGDDAGSDEFDFGGGDEETKSDEDGDDAGSDEFDFGDDTEEGDDEDFDFGDDTEEVDDEDLGDGDDEIKDIQSTTGKLGQQLRDVEDLSSDMQKWVAKSVLSALNLDNMDSEDKKDIIRTVKRKSKEEESKEEESFDFGSEEPMEEDYEHYMKDNDSNLLTRKDLGMGDDTNYMSYMKDKNNYSQKEVNDWLNDMEMSGFGETTPKPMYDSFMSDKTENNPHIGGDEDEDPNKLLLDFEEDETLYNPNLKAHRQARKDMVPHYLKHAGPGYEERPSNEWRRNLLPDNSNFRAGYSEYDDFMSETDIMDELETYEQELAYNDVVDMASEYGFTVGFCHKDKSEDPEEQTIYLDIKDGKKKVMKARINSVGNIELGTMRGMHFIGEPIDTFSDFDEALGEDGIIDTMGPQREKSPETKPGRETETKPGRESKPDTDRPSRRPFSPPPGITPGEEPGPKAGDERWDGTYPSMAPQPAKEPETTPTEPTTKPGRESKPDEGRPSRRPFSPPPGITPGEEPGPKAGDETSYMSYMGDEDKTSNQPTRPIKPPQRPQGRPNKPFPKPIEPDLKPRQPNIGRRF